MFSRKGFTVLSVAVASLVVAGLAGPAALGAVAPDDDTKTVAYRGLELQVPDDWRVVDLEKTPSACVGFAKPTVYLGRPGAQSNCPARALGGTAGLVLEPLERARIVPDQRGTTQRVDKSARVLVRAYSQPKTAATVEAVLDSAGARLEKPKAATAPKSTLQAGIVTPGDYTGRGFDTCAALNDTQMNTWWEHSPYRVVGIYFSGISRYCPHNIDAAWVTRHADKGWRFIPIEVGLQAPCTNYPNRMSSNATTARSQGEKAATDAVANAQRLGIGPGSAIYNDIEAYSRGGTCTAAVLSFTSGWTNKLHELGYVSGFYSSAASGVADQVAAYNDSRYTRVDHIWFAWWNNRPDVDGGSYIPSSYWNQRQRLHQYSGEVTESYGGVSMNIDGDYLDVARPANAPKDCHATRLDFKAYGAIQSGATGDLVLAAQCLLEKQGHDVGTPDGTFGESTVTAVKAFQTKVGLPSNGAVDSHTWIALLSAGGTRQIQSGAIGDPVFRLQRALTAALGKTVGIDGFFGSGTATAVKEYQSSRGLSADGIVGVNSWKALQSGK